MKKFIIIVPVKRVNGWQQYICDAEDEKEALKKWKRGDCDLIYEDIMVVSLGEPEIRDEE